MRGLSKMRFALFLAVSVLAANYAMAGQVVSQARNVNAVMQARGFYLAPAQAVYAGYSPTGSDLAPVQSFEIIRPRGEKVTIGRLYTSCTCVQLETSQRTFEQGERAVLNLHNVMPTPPGGQNYAIYVQITSPIRTTLRYDTFVQSSQFVSQAPTPVSIQELEPEIVEDKTDMADNTSDEQLPAYLDTAESSVQEVVAETMETAGSTGSAEEADETTARGAADSLKIREVHLPEDVISALAEEHEVAEE